MVHRQLSMASRERRAAATRDNRLCTLHIAGEARTTRRLDANISLVAALLLATAAPASGPAPRGELTVHLAQANNSSPYAFVRAKFAPGEVADPWAVRFFDLRGQEVPYFVWDSITWQVAREGRQDWGHRYALLNHHPGDSPAARQMRPRRIAAAMQQMPELGAALAAGDEAARRHGDSVCAALYLVRHSVPPLGKDKLTLRIDPSRRVEATHRTLEAPRVAQRLTAAAGELELEGLPDRLSVRWKGRELVRYAGFKLGDKSAGKDGSIADGTHADPTRPFSIEVSEGIITKLLVRGQTAGRAGSDLHWQCTYWLFPEGSYVALKGFSFDNTDGYLGGGLSMSVWETTRQPREVHPPLWEKPWWLHQIGDGAFVAIHQFTDTPLAVGYGNNPFNASTPSSFHVSSGERTKGSGDGVLELNWQYDLTDNRVYRLFHPRLDGDRSFDLAEVTDLRETLLTHGKLTRVPHDATGKDGRALWPPERVSALEAALAYVKWRPREDWLYRQYLVGVGESADEAERGVLQVLGAAAGWLDRPIQEDDLAERIVQFSLRKSSQAAQSPQAWMALPAVLKTADRERVRQALQGCSDPADVAADAMQRIRQCAAGGASPLDGTTKDEGRR
jgi:hypothetical protein